MTRVAILAWGVFLSALTGVLIDVRLAEDGKAVLRLFNYYTIQSNLIVAVTAALAAWHGVSPPPWLAPLGQAVSVWICVTGLGYHFLLAKIYHPEGWQAVANQLLHYITPLGMILYAQLAWYGQPLQPLLWISYPLLYSVFNIIRGHVTGYYPYWFMRPEGVYPEGNGSYARVFAFMVILLIAFCLIGYVLNAWQAVFGIGF